MSFLARRTAGSYLANIQTFTTTQVVPVPVSVSNAVVELWGETGFGGHGNNTIPTQGGGGGSGGYTMVSFPVNNAGSFSLVMGIGGGVTTSTVTPASIPGFPTLSAPGGGNGAIATAGGGGAGGAAGAIGTGGTTNAVGVVGNAGDPGGDGKGGAAVVGINGTGNNGGNGNYNTTTITAGKPAVCVIKWT